MHDNITFKKGSKKSLIRIWGLLFLIASYSFLAYKLFTYNQYPQLLEYWKHVPNTQFWWLLVVFLLLPANWVIESVKWKYITVHIQSISLKTAIKGVLAGISTGFFTPNRVGELVGRVMYLDAENRKSGVTLSLLSGMTQSFVMTLSGLPACIIFFSTTKNNFAITGTYLIFILFFLIGLGLLYFFLPRVSQLFSKSRFSGKIKEYTDCLLKYSARELFLIISISVFRYSVFCVQFYCMLRFFGIELTILQAVIAIPTSYLFVTFTPSFAFSDAAVRGSIAVLVIGVFCPNEISIALAGICIWLINFVIPMLVGSVILVRKN
ncbi:MAG: lysylphosphatidylglycerol synthase domain-containing protein [Paludibacter sp.]